MPVNLGFALGAAAIVTGTVLGALAVYGGIRWVETGTLRDAPVGQPARKPAGSHG